MSVMSLSAKMDRTDGSTPWGFRMAGGKDFGSPLIIQKVNPGSLAAKCGLQEGDTIVRIGRVPADALRHKDAQNAIMDSGNSLELALERSSRSSHGVSHVAPPTDNYSSYAPSPASFGAPKQYNDGASSISSHLGSLNIGSPQRGTEGGDDLSMLHETSSSDLHDNNNSLHASFTRNIDENRKSPPPLPDGPPPPLPGNSPPPMLDHPSPPHLESASRLPDKPPPRVPDKPPPPITEKPPMHSAIYDEQKEEDHPRYHGFQDPGSQSRTFKKLQNMIETGQDVQALRSSSPVSGKPSVGVKPVFPPKPGSTSSIDVTVTRSHESVKDVENVETSVGTEEIVDVSTERKTIVIPSAGRSKLSNALPPTAGNIDVLVDVPSERKTIVIPSANRTKLAAEPVPVIVGSSYNPTEFTDDSQTKKYYPSETCKLVQEQESGLSQSRINPLTGAEIRSTQSRTLLMLDRTLDQNDTIDVSVERKTVVIPGNKTQSSKSDTIDVSVERKTIVIPGNKSQTRAPPPAQAAASPRPGQWQPQVPTGPRKMRVAQAGEAKSLPAISGGARIPICNGCGTAIRGPFISALDKTWCPDHFICANPHCQTPLINIGFVEEEGQLYCEKDYEQYFAPKCGKCGRSIIGEVVNAMKNTFHMGCFLCCQCNQPIGTGSFHNEDGKIYCPKDWAAMFQTKCYGCQFPIEPGDRWVEALNQNWHSECFNCSTCQVNLEGQSFFAKNGKPYCKKHSATGRF